MGFYLIFVFQDLIGSAVTKIGKFGDLDTQQQMVASIETVSYSDHLDDCH
jgi:hypothetical protein